MTVILPCCIVYIWFISYCLNIGYFLWQGELGIVETLTVLCSGGAAWSALRLLWLDWSRFDLILRIALCCFILGCIYIAGEEMSWGQHYFGWQTPQWWSHYNAQQETNFHNTSRWLNHYPRNVLSIALLVFTVAPLLFPKKKWNDPVQNPRLWWAFPERQCLPVILLAVTINMPARLNHEFDDELFIYPPFSVELREMFISWALLLIIVSFSRRQVEG